MLLHLSFRVKDPARSGVLYAALLDGRTVAIGPPLDSIGVCGVAFGRNVENVLLDQIELWPLDKHWSAGRFVEVEARSGTFGHFAIESDKSGEQLAALAERHGATFRLEERGMPYLVPVVYDYDGNFVEFFRPAVVR